MKSIGLFGKSGLHLETRETEVKAPGCNDVVVKIHACGICGTDINFLKQWTGEAMPLGHEIAAEVMETGAEVEVVKPGDQVIVEDVAMCGVCDDCKTGRPDLCVNGYDLRNQPGMGQYMNVRAGNLVKFTGLDYSEACLTEPLAVALNSVLTAEIPLHGSVAVLGCGPLGLMSARVAKLRGAGFVAMTEINTDTPLGRARTEAAAALGVDIVIDATREDPGTILRKQFPRGVDRVIVSAPPESIKDAVRIVGYGGIIAFYGLHFNGGNMVTIDINHLIFNKISLRPVFAEPAINFRVALELLKNNSVPAKEIITHEFELNQAENVFKMIIEGSEPVVKAVMRTRA